MTIYPGLPLPVNEIYECRFPSAVPDWQAAPITALEIQMLRLMNQLTEKADWMNKIYDSTIVQKWRSEATTAQESMVDDTAFDYCLAELKVKAAHLQATGLISVFDTEARVVKSDSLVSDALIHRLRNSCRDLMRAQGEEPDMHPGTHVQDLIHPSVCPLSYGRSRVHQEELVAVGNAVTNFAGTGERLPEAPWDDQRVSSAWEDSFFGTLHTERNLWSKKYQWLPANFSKRADGSIEATSYINGLHPRKHRAVYRTIEQLIEVVIPAWEQCLSIHPERAPLMHVSRSDPRFKQPSYPMEDSSIGRRIGIARAPETQYPYILADLYEMYKADRQRSQDEARQRARLRGNWKSPWKPVTIRPGMIANHLGVQGIPTGIASDSRLRHDGTPGGTTPELGDEIYEQFKEDGDDEFEYWVNGENKPVIYPSAPPFEGRNLAPNYDLQKPLKERGLQVMVKLVSMGGIAFCARCDKEHELAFPTQPGNWHVEGQLNEHIVATALVYFDTANLEPETLRFRQMVDRHAVEYQQGEFSSQQGVFGLDFEMYGLRMQELGSVDTKQGRLLAFPNVLQHAVSPLKLKDEGKPAHRRFIALWLVDPNVRVISTANVAPQQMNWWLEAVLRRNISTDDEKNYLALIAEASGINAFKQLPLEVMDLIRAFIDEDRTLLYRDEIDSVREDLMRERSNISERMDGIIQRETFNFCEH